MRFFRLGVATEANNYIEEQEDQIWVKSEDGHLVLVEDSSDDKDKE